jgi:hypothetical protein
MSLSIDAFFQAMSIIVAILTFTITSTISRIKDRKITKRDVYQKLEFASIDLFRFEAENVDLIRPIWEDATLIPPKSKAEYIVTLNYVCQMLNLFELAVKFRRNKTMPSDIFGSWVAWFFLLIKAPGFAVMWDDLRFDYTEELRCILDKGVSLKEKSDDEDKIKVDFYRYVGSIMKCSVIDKWIDNHES